jgi:hypothetical protein
MNRDWDVDDSRGGGVGDEQCSNGEIDSMFSTLDGE